MKSGKQKQLEKAGWKVGDAADFLRLTEDERRFVEMKLALAGAPENQKTYVDGLVKKLEAKQDINQ